jgi:hypothetical protein
LDSRATKIFGICKQRCGAAKNLRIYQQKQLKFVLPCSENFGIVTGKEIFFEEKNISCPISEEKYAKVC